MTFSIETTAWNAGCLMPLLTREIAAVERQVRVCGDRQTPEDRELTEAYLGQLRGLLADVEAAWPKQ